MDARFHFRPRVDHAVDFDRTVLVRLEFLYSHRYTDWPAENRRVMFVAVPPSMSPRDIDMAFRTLTGRFGWNDGDRYHRSRFVIPRPASNARRRGLYSEADRPRTGVTGWWGSGPNADAVYPFDPGVTATVFAGRNRPMFWHYDFGDSLLMEVWPLATLDDDFEQITLLNVCGDGVLDAGFVPEPVVPNPVFCELDDRVAVMFG